MYNLFNLFNLFIWIFKCFVINFFNLNTPMDQPEYMQLKIDDVPAEIITKYKLRELVDDNNCLYIEVTKGMYGLPHADIPAQQQLEKRLNQHAYHQSSIIPDFWTHESRPISFPLVVHDFGVKCVGQEHTQHLLNVLKQHNKVKWCQIVVILSHSVSF